MAEALAVVASGVGIASFALQLVDTATRLRALWADIKDAPLEVIQLVREIELLGSLLGAIKTTNTPIEDNDSFQAVFDQCYTWCKESAQNLEKVVNEFETLIKQRKPFGAVRIVLKKDKIAKLRSHLERAKSSLLLAQQMSLSMQSAYHTSLQTLQLQKTEIILTTQERMLCQPSQPVYSPLSAGCNQRANIPAFFEHGDSENDGTTAADRNIPDRRRPTRYHKRQKHHLAFRTPAWLIGRVWDIRVKEACSGWTLGLSIYNIRPESAQVFKYTMDGDLHSLQRLFDRAEASPFDRDPHGHPLLHIAAFNKQPEVCRFLIAQGVDSRARDFRARTALRWLINVPSGDSSQRGKLLDLYRLIITQADTDELIDSESVLELFTGISGLGILPEGMRILQNTICFPWTSIPLTERVKLAATVYRDVETLKLVLGPGPLPKEAFEYGPCAFPGDSLFSCMATNIGCCCHHEDDDAAWQLVLKEAIGLGAHLCFPSQARSPLTAFLNSMMLNHTKIGRSEQPYHYWLQSLQRAGVDLVEYGQEERKALKDAKYRSSVSTWRRLCSGRDGSGEGRSSDIIGHANIIDLTFGPEPEDWHIWFSWPFDEWAGEFWYMVENPELFDIPGAWPV